MHDEFLAASQIRRVQPRKPDFRDNFWQQVPDMRPTVAREARATFNRCIFDHAAKKVYHYPGCEHQTGWNDDDGELVG